MTIKVRHRRDVCGDAIVLNLDCGGSHISLKCCNGIYSLYISGGFLGAILYYSY